MIGGWGGVEGYREEEWDLGLGSWRVQGGSREMFGC